MNADLDALIRLQETHDRISSLTQRIDTEIPSQIAEIETALREVREQLEAEQAAIQAAQKERARLEFEFKSAEEKIAKYKAALMQVKNNDEYRAALNEIDYAARTQSDLETSLLEIMEGADARQAQLKELEERFQTEDERIRADREVLEKQRAKLLHEQQREQKIAAEIEATLPDPLRDQYRRIADTRGGIGLSIARDQICSACRMRLRPYVYQQVRRNQKILTCDACTRILYFVETDESEDQPGVPQAGGQSAGSEPAAAPQPASANESAG